MGDAIVLRHERRQGDPRPPRGRGLPGDRDADPDPLDPRGRARLPRAEPPGAGLLVRAAAVAAALQAAADDRRLRALLPDRPLLPRRGLPRRPPARVHAARHGDGVRGGGGRDRHDRPAAAARCCALGGIEVPSSARANDLRRGDAALRLRPARPPASASRSRTSATVFAASEFKVFRGALARAAWSGRSRPRGELPRSRFDALTEQAQALGAKGLAWGVVEAGRLALAGRQVPLRGRDRRGRSRRTGAREGDAILDRGRQRRRGGARARRAAARGGRARAGGPRPLLGRRLPDVRVERGRGALGCDAPPLHGAERRPRRRPRQLAQPRLRHGAGRLGDRRRLDPHQHPRAAAEGLRRARHRARGGAASASASCSRRCPTARRRTAASPSASTASWRCSPARARSAT